MYIALDIGGTKWIAASANPNGDILKRVQHPVEQDPRKGIELLYSMIEEVRVGTTEITSIGASAGGPLNYRTGEVSSLHLDKWINVPLKKYMEEKYQCPFAVEVDTDIAALAEYNIGTSSSQRLLYITLSTGLGGGFLLDGQIYRGTKGCHPEIGHQTVPFRHRNKSEVQCPCGAMNCLEALISGSAIQRNYGIPPEELPDEDWKDIGYNLGHGLRNMSVMYTPDEIILGGGIAINAHEKFLSVALSVMRDNTRIVPVPEVKISTLGTDTALMGALVLAKQVVQR
jgi:predicted NBD/HSP70 family sugar kinase